MKNSVIVSVFGAVLLSTNSVFAQTAFGFFKSGIGLNYQSLTETENDFVYEGFGPGFTAQIGGVYHCLKYSLEWTFYDSYANGKNQAEIKRVEIARKCPGINISYYSSRAWYAGIMAGWSKSSLRNRDDFRIRKADVDTAYYMNYIDTIFGGEPSQESRAIWKEDDFSFRISKSMEIGLRIGKDFMLHAKGNSMIGIELSAYSTIFDKEISAKAISFGFLITYGYAFGYRDL